MQFRSTAHTRQMGWRYRARPHMCWQERGMWTFQSVCAAGGDGVTWDRHLGKQSAGYEKVKHILALSSGHSMLGNYTSEIDIQVHTKTTHMNAYKALEIQT